MVQPEKGSSSRPIAFATLRLSPGNFASEGVQALLPKSAKLVYPGVDLLKRLRIHRINPLRSVDADSDEAALAQCTEMLRNARLRYAELVPDDLRETAGGALAAGKEFQNPTPYRIAENVKSMHGSLGALQPWPV
jgi:hypothetical protein